MHDDVDAADGGVAIPFPTGACSFFHSQTDKSQVNVSQTAVSRIPSLSQSLLLFSLSGRDYITGFPIICPGGGGGGVENWEGRGGGDGRPTDGQHSLSLEDAFTLVI